MILGVAIFTATGRVEWILFPLVLRSFGVFATIIGMLTVPFWAQRIKDPMGALNGGYWTITVLSIGGLAATTILMLEDVWHWFFLCGIVGIATGIAFVYITQYYTAGAWRPVQEIARASKTGSATNIIIGTAVGFETTAVTAITVSLALVGSFVLGQQADLTNVSDISTGVFGTAVATMGMLMSAAYVLAMDTFGPITDNAGGITEMAEDSKPEAREITDALDTVGNTTKALTKGYAVGSAALAAFLLFTAYLDEVRLEFGKIARDDADRFVTNAQDLNLLPQGNAIKTEAARAIDEYAAAINDVDGFSDTDRDTLVVADEEETAAILKKRIDDGDVNEADVRGITGSPVPLPRIMPINLGKVEVFIGALLGVMLAFLFSSLAIRAVGKAAGGIIEEVQVRRQFREHPGIMDRTERPDYTRAVDITTRSALREMVAPGLLAVGLPIATGLIFRYAFGGDGNEGWLSVAGVLMVGTIGGVLLATYLNNAGGAWDNAKKFIESGQMQDDAGDVVGKGTEIHAAAVVGDTVGDPFKDTAGPALHVLVKLLATISLVLAPLFIS
jgi:H(+)-translocating pyrophosphatase